MSTAEERMRILKMVADKQITAEEGARLLEALRGATREAGPQQEPGKAHWLRVRVTDKVSGKSKINVNIPIGLVDVAFKMGARFAPEMAGMDIAAIQAALKEGMQGRILEVDDEAENERVEIFVE